MPNTEKYIPAQEGNIPRKLKEAWISGSIDTLDYLLYVNKYANRSFNAVQTQYPIMPWVGRCVFNKDKFDTTDDLRTNGEQHE